MTRMFVFSADVLSPAEVDEAFQDQADALASRGFAVGFVDLQAGRVAPRSMDLAHRRVMYRGWMLSPGEYSELVKIIEEGGGKPFHSLGEYLACHYLPNWYEAIEDLTPETVVLPEEANLAEELRKLDWEGFFVKDYVKSLKTSRGSIVRDPQEAPLVAAEMRKFRGRIEGGFCIRRLEDLLLATETRYFVLEGEVFGPSRETSVPDVVKECAQRITGSGFFSVDVIERRDGVLRVVEVGDGQVSDLVGWTVPRFTEIWS